MSERPISLPGPMVRAILDGRKTQTQKLVRITGSELATALNAFPRWHAARDVPGVIFPDGADSMLGIEIKTPFQPGDCLWVRETWAVQHDMDHLKPSEMMLGDARLHYAATEERGGLLWRSPLFMPHWASRICLRVHDVRVQRLQEISEEEARAEGLHWWSKDGQLRKWGLGERHRSGELDFVEEWADMAHSHAEAFGRLWNSINAKRAPWASNPWVWVISFERLP